MSPTAKELCHGSFIPDGATFTVSPDGAEEINRYLDPTSSFESTVQPGDKLVYYERRGLPGTSLDSKQKTLTLVYPDGSGVMCIDPDLDAFESVVNLPDWYIDEYGS